MLPSLVCLASDAADADALTHAVAARHGAAAAVQVRRLDRSSAPATLHWLTPSDAHGVARPPALLEAALDHAIAAAAERAPRSTRSSADAVIWPLALHLLGGAAEASPLPAGEACGELPAALLPLGRAALDERLALLADMRVRHVVLSASAAADRALACRLAQRCALLVAPLDALDHCLAYYRLRGWLPFAPSPTGATPPAPVELTESARPRSRS